MSHIQLTAQQVLERITREIAATLAVSVTRVAPHVRFRELGLGSADTTVLAAKLSADYGVALPATAPWQFPTPEALAVHVVALVNENREAARGGAGERAALLGASAVRSADRAPADAVPVPVPMSEPIAIVGMACRLPGGVNSPDDLWRLLTERKSGIREVPADRWSVAEFVDEHDPATPGKMVTRWGGFIDDVDAFDAEFFGISPREARQMDPQQRLVLELAWESLEDAGVEPLSLRDQAVGVFVGSMWSDYARLIAGSPEAIEQHTATGQDTSIISARVSYALGLAGASLTVNTACSSSLVAIHLACQSLRLGETTCALAGGVHLMLSPESTVAMTKFGAMNPDGECRAFDASAGGYVRAEGAGVVVLKPLSRAIADGDRVYATIRATAANNDGFSNGLTAPNPAAQAAVLRAAYAAAGVDPADVQYVETHGPGTILGDPLEAQALAEVLGSGRPLDRPLRIGSIKTNIGHLEAAAGVAGVMKAALSLHHRTLVPNLHFERPNPNIPFADWRLRVQTALEPWRLDESGRALAGVSSFGFGGTNAHAVLEAAPPASMGAGTAVETGTPGAKPFVVSARTVSALHAQAARLRDHLATHGELSLSDIGFSLGTVRTGFEHRAAIVAANREELTNRLGSLASGDFDSRVVTGRSGGRPSVAFLFTGQGSQRAGMGRELYRAYPVFRAALNAVCGAMDPHLDRALRVIMFADAGSVEAGLLDHTAYTQPALFALEVAMFRLLESWGVHPDRLLGHSIGEIAAAHVAGVLSLEDACTLVAARGRLMQELPTGGAMFSIQATEAEIRPIIAPYAALVDIAALNGPLSTVVSGDEAAAADVARHFASLGRATTRLTVSHAFHSPRMEPMLDAFRAVLRTLTFCAPSMPIVSNVSGREATAEELCDPEYWVRHVRGTVRFLDGMRAVESAGSELFLELGPQGILSGLGATCLADPSRGRLVPTMSRHHAEDESVASALGALFTAGVAPNWNAVFTGARRVDLPTYAFQRQRYWLSGLRRERVALKPSESSSGEDDALLVMRWRPLPSDADAASETTDGLRGSDTVVRVAETAGDAARAIRDRMAEVLEALRTWLASERDADARLVIVTRGGLAVEAGEVPDPAAAAVWGLARVARRERADDKILIIDLSLDAVEGPAVAAALRSGERHVAIRGGRAYAPVLRRASDEDLITLPTADWRLDVTDRGTIDAVRPVATDAAHRPLRQGEVRIAVRAAGLNFRDVLNTLGMYPGDAGPMGLEPAGVVLEVGPGVDFVPGDRVMGLVAGAFGPVAIADARTVMRVPDAWTFAEAAAAPVAFLTAYHALVDLAQLRSGERILVHAAAGGVGMAAVQLARHLGAEVHATASDSKREMVRRLGVPDERLASSRTLEFATRFRVNVVLNALAGEFTDASLSTLSSGGRFIEMGKTDLRDPGAIARAHPGVAYRSFDLMQLPPDDVQRMLRALAPLFASGNLRPPPLRAWDIREARQAFAHMASARHIGKLVLTIPRRLDANGAVVITGGTGGLGALVARRLVTEHGARHLVIASRRGPSAPECGELRDELTALGASVDIVACDVADHAAVERMLGDVERGRPITGIVHLAATLDEGVIDALTPERIDRLLCAKVDGAMHLDALTRNRDVAMFLAFSSAAGTIGFAGTAGYAAANTALEAVVQRRARAGLPAQSIAWGPWAERGMVAGLDHAEQRRLRRQGIKPLPPTAAIRLFDAALGRAEVSLTAVRLDLAAAAATGDDLSEAMRELAAPAPGVSSARSPLGIQLGGLAADERESEMVRLVTVESVVVLGLDAGAPLAPDRPLQQAGLDSLMAVELRSRIAKLTGLSLPATLLFDYPTPIALARFLTSRLLSGDEHSLNNTGLPAAVTVANDDDPIAIVGMACRYPGGVRSPEDLWRILEQGVDAVTPFPTDRGWDLASLYDGDRELVGTTYARGGGFIDDPALFDAEFFGLSPREAESTDPQQRLLLEMSWEALERAGIAPTSLHETATGVFVGVVYDDYARLMPDARVVRDGYPYLGTARAITSGRIAYTLGLQGPAITIDTACSSSLVAIHLAAQSLRQGECTLALAGGATVFATPDPFVIFSRLKTLSPDGRSRAFSADADGAGWAEGAGVLVLERLSDARKHGHRVLAIVRGSAVNQDGRSQGLTAPNGPSQERMIHQALASANVSAADVDAVDAHGTGTTLGDPIEAQALLATYGAAHSAENPLWIGTVKSNLGHPQAAAGVAGVMKMVLAMRHGMLPRTLHAERPSPFVDWTRGTVRLLNDARSWERGERVRRAGISSFGISGTNGHVIIEEPPTDEVRRTLGGGSLPILLSARSASALAAQAAALCSHLGEHTELSLADVAHTLAVGRAHFAFRAAVVATERASVIGALRALAGNAPHADLLTSSNAMADERATPELRRHLDGGTVDWASIAAPIGGAVVELPTYPFERERYWVTPTEQARGRQAGRHRLSGTRTDLPDGAVHHVIEVGPALQRELGDHVVHGRVVIPGAFYVSVLLAIAEAHWPEREIVLRDVQFTRALSFDDTDAQTTLHVQLRESSDGFDATLSTRRGEAWITHATASLAPGSSADAVSPPALDDLSADVVASLDDALRAVHIEWGPRWSGVESAARLDDDTLVARLHANESTADAPVAARAIDNAFGLTVWPGVTPVDADVPRLPFAVNRVSWTGRASAIAVVKLEIREIRNDGATIADVRLWDANGQQVAALEGLITLRAPADRFLSNDADGALYRVEWHRAELGRGGEHAEPHDGEPINAMVVDLGAMTLNDPSAAVKTALGFIQSWLADASLGSVPLVLQTRGAVSTGADDVITRPSLSSVWGLGRVAQTEHPDRALYLVDADDATSNDSIRRVVASGHREAALRNGVMLTPRLVRIEGDRTDSPDVAFNSDALARGTVVVTGGTGALGSAVARHLVVEYGVRRLLLLSRRGDSAAGARELVAELQSRGALVSIIACDVSDRVALAAALASVDEAHAITGVVHCAGLLDDGVVSRLTPDRINGVMRAKVDAAWHLHDLTSDHPLAAFVLFSSISGIAGTAGQGNYASANAGLDALALVRRAAGRPATAIAWGLWSAGMGSRLNETERERQRAVGIAPLDTARALTLLDAALASGEANVVAASLDTIAIAKAGSTTGLLSSLARRTPSTTRAASGSDALRAQLAEHAEADRERTLLSLVRSEIAKILRLPSADGIKPERSIQEIGLDSLMAVELRGRLVAATGLRLPATLLFDHPTPTALARVLREMLTSASGRPTPAAPARRSPSARRAADEDAIAIVGMACRFPGGVETPEALWSVLAEGRDVTGPLPVNRAWPVDDLYDADPDAVGRTYTQGGGFLDRPDLFDATLFGLSPREAAAADPQQRLLLETSWEALERAGISPLALDKSATGVFVGVCYEDYMRLAPPPELARDGYPFLGTARSVASGRIAYTLGLEGPAITVDTACSSSLVALHLATQALRNGECSLALCGGATVFATPEPLITFARLRTLSPDGRCRSFSADADGAGWAEGVGMLALERVSTARRAGRRILAVLRGSAINQDGRSQGMTAPNGPAQQRVIAQALATAGLHPADVDAVDGHGTATPLGDPIEAQALIAAYGEHRPSERPLWLGSVKSNLGHAQAAAGVAGVMKMVLALQHEIMPRTLHAEHPSGHVDWSSGVVRLLDVQRPWPRGERIRRAGVSSFGISGTNAHVLIEEAPPESAPVVAKATMPTVVPVVLSAKTPDALRSLAAQWRVRASAVDETSLLDLAYTAGTARAHFDRRAVLIAGDRAGLVATLDDMLHDRPTPRVIEGTAREQSVAVLFTGQGSQRPGMGRQLYESQPAFRAALDAVFASMAPHLERSLRDLMFAAAGSSDAALVDRTAYTQPALFAIEVALYRLMESVGIRADYLLGHSVGELAAAHVAGVLSLDEACELVAARGRLMDQLPSGGAMISLGASEAEVAPLVAERATLVSIAAVNGPASAVVSGDESAVAEIAAYFTSLGRPATRLSVSHAFHSPRMDAMLSDFALVARRLTYHPAAIPIVSSVTGMRATDADLCSPDYWVRQAREAVRFADGVRALEHEGMTVLLEAGPQGVLTALASAQLADAGANHVTCIPLMRRDGADDDAVASALGRLYAGGMTVDWSAFFAPFGPRYVDAPTYVFQRDSYWLSARATLPVAQTLGPSGTRVDLPDGSVLHVVEVGPGADPETAHHVIHRRIVVPAAGYVSILFAVAKAHWPNGALEVRDAQFVRALTFDDPSASATLHVHLVPSGEGYLARLSTRDGDAWVTHATATIQPGAEASLPTSAMPLPDESMFDRAMIADIDRGMRAISVEWGAPWWWLDSAGALDDRTLVGRLRAPDSWRPDGGPVPVSALDNCIGASNWQLYRPDGDGNPHLPFAIDRVVWHGADRLPHVMRTTHRGPIDGSEHTWDMALWDDTGAPFVTVEGYSARHAPANLLLGSSRVSATRDLHVLEWRDVPLVDAPSSSANDIVIDARPSVSAFENAAQAARANTARVLAAAQAWIGAEPGSSRLVVLTTNGVVVNEHDPLNIVQSPVWGLVRTMQLEHVDRSIVLVDLDGQPESEAALWSALATGEAQLAVRAGRVFAPRVTRATAASGPAATFDVSGTVLIVGGTGGVGAHVARHLARKHEARRLLLVSRRGAESPGALDLRAELESAGVSVRIVACDASDRDALAGLIGSIEKEHPLRAVIHAGGILDDGVFANLDAERLDAVMRVKADAAVHLDALTRELPELSFVMFSSVAGILGNAGQASYAAANSFLDALAVERRSIGLHAQTIAWGPWSGVGMASGITSAVRSRGGLRILPLAVPDALAMFDAALERSEPLIVAARLDAAPTKAVTGAVASELVTRMRKMRGADRSAAMLELVRGEAARVLGAANGGGLADDLPLRELGLDSLMAVELRNGLARALGAQLPATLIFDHPTLAGLAKHLLTRVQIDDDAVVETSARGAPKRTSRPMADDPIAIVGMGCRFPGGANNPTEFWEFLRRGGDGVVDVPPDRFDIDEYYDPALGTPGKIVTRRGAFLSGVDDFDPAFFGLSAGEAATMDPQQRLLLEVAWETLEDAGISARAAAGTSTGVFVGVPINDHYKLMGSAPTRAATGIQTSIAANRLSYFYDFNGPSVSLDTACSSALVAVAMACDSLRTGSADMALAGGVNVILFPDISIAFSAAGMLSPDGQCRTFDSRANGYVRGEGCGLVMLKRLSDALADGDRIHGVIRAACTNNNGRTNGLTAPNSIAQEALIRQALRRAEVDPADVGYVEAHGTGTPLGDPIEVEALRATYGSPRSNGEACVLGSVKTNIGHLECAAGVAGLIKAVLCITHGEIPPHLHLEELNPNISFDGTPFVVTKEVRPWPRGRRPRLAAVSSFGFGGANGHVIVEEAPGPRAPTPAVDRPAHLLTLSARSATALRLQARRFAAHMDEYPDVPLANLAYTANSGRNVFAHRLVVRAASSAEAGEALSRFAEGISDERVRTAVRTDASRPSILFRFGDDDLTPSVVSRLRDTQPGFRSDFDRLATTNAAAAARFSLAGLWRRWGVEPAALAGSLAASYAPEDDHLARLAVAGDVEQNYTHAIDIGDDIAMGDDPWPMLLETLGALWLAGLDVDWRSFDADYPRRRVTLPTYPFERIALDVSDVRSLRVSSEARS